jgi:hypothetical protein
MKMMVLRMIMAAMAVHGVRRLRIAQNEVEPTLDGRQHETCGNERAQAQHRENEWRSPVACATGPEPIRASSHAITMPKDNYRIK